MLVRTAIALSVAIAFACATPLSIAHPANVPAEQYIRFLSDCSDDWGGHSAIRDGHDLVALDMTERWMEEFDEPGFFVAMVVGFGYAQTNSRGAQLREDIELTLPSGAVRVRIISDDNRVFRGQEAQGYRLPDVLMPSRPSLYPNGTQDGTRVVIEFGFRYSSLKIEEGQKITSARVQAWAGSEKGDYMPGGYFVAGVEYTGCDPSGSHGGTYNDIMYIRKDYAMRGTEVPFFSLALDSDTLATSGSTPAKLTVTLSNKFSKQPQVVSASAIGPKNWDAVAATPQGAMATPSGKVLVEFTLTPKKDPANGTLVLEIKTDVGGRATREVPVIWARTQEELPPSTTPAESPGIAIWTFVVALVWLIASRSRRAK